MDNLQQEADSINVRIQQLEKRQDVTTKYAVKVGQKLKQLADKFNALQKLVEQQQTDNHNLNGTATTDKVISHGRIFKSDGDTTIVEAVEEGNIEIVRRGITIIILKSAIALRADAFSLV